MTAVGRTRRSDRGPANTAGFGVRREKAALSSGCKAHENPEKSRLCTPNVDSLYGKMWIPTRRNFRGTAVCLVALAATTRLHSGSFVKKKGHPEDLRIHSSVAQISALPLLVKSLTCGGMNLDLTDDETAALERLLSDVIDRNRYPLSPQKSASPSREKLRPLS
jgi:hypothetical protein